MKQIHTHKHYNYQKVEGFLSVARRLLITFREAFSINFIRKTKIKEIYCMKNAKKKNNIKNNN